MRSAHHADMPRRRRTAARADRRARHRHRRRARPGRPCSGGAPACSGADAIGKAARQETVGDQHDIALAGEERAPARRARRSNAPPRPLQSCRMTTAGNGPSPSGLQQRRGQVLRHAARASNGTTAPDAGIGDLRAAPARRAPAQRASDQAPTIASSRRSPAKRARSDRAQHRACLDLRRAPRHCAHGTGHRHHRRQRALPDRGARPMSTWRRDRDRRSATPRTSCASASSAAPTWCSCRATAAATASRRREINFRANIDALKRAGVTDLISLSAVGSLKPELPPGSFVLVDQFIDRTFARAKSFFGTGCVAHVSMAHPVCAPARRPPRRGGARGRHRDARAAAPISSWRGRNSRRSPRAISIASWGCDVIGMTNMPEAKLAREAELCYATVAMVTDFDCWHPDHDHVTVEQIIARAAAPTPTRRKRLITAAVPLHRRRSRLPAGLPPRARPRAHHRARGARSGAGGEARRGRGPRARRSSAMNVARQADAHDLARAGRRSVGIIDQTRLPHRFATARLATLDDGGARDPRHAGARRAADRRRRRLWRGAGDARAMPSDAALDAACRALLATRPTAVNLRWALEDMRAHARCRCRRRARAAAAYRARRRDRRRGRRDQPRASPAHGLPLIEARVASRRASAAGRDPHPLQCRLARDGRLGHGARADLSRARPAASRSMSGSTRRGRATRAPASPPGSSASTACRTR